MIINKLLVPNLKNAVKSLKEKGFIVVPATTTSSKQLSSRMKAKTINSVAIILDTSTSLKMKLIFKTN